MRVSTKADIKELCIEDGNDKSRISITFTVLKKDDVLTKLLIEELLVLFTRAEVVKLSIEDNA